MPSKRPEETGHVAPVCAGTAIFPATSYDHW